jgi:pyruvate kinase
MKGEFMPSPKSKKTKIICTIGPSSWSPEVIKAMVDAGMDIARVNGAFASPSELDKVKKLIRDISDEVELMVDVKGPEVRLNKFNAPLPIKKGDKVVIGNTEKDPIYPANYPNLYKHLKPGQRMVVGDGDVELRLEKIEGDQMHCTVVAGQVIKPGKALNLPGADYTSQVLTEKDKVNLKHAMETGWDSVSASFIQNGAAAQEVRDFIGDKLKLVAKIEDQEGIDNIDDILKIVDEVMIARGGLGVELGLEKVHKAQRYLTKKCKDAGVPSITATEMLQSMMESPKPTRAEVSDVTTAVLLGSDAVMLSGETAAGKFPVEAVEYLSKIVMEAENYNL